MILIGELNPVSSFNMWQVTMSAFSDGAQLKPNRSVNCLLGIRRSLFACGQSSHFTRAQRLVMECCQEVC